VNDFKERLHVGDLDLTKEMELAHRINMTESVRNVMISTFLSLDIFPPAKLATHVDDGDCNYEDVSAPLLVIAQQLYNDQAQRVRDAIGEHSRVERQANTAAFLVDFASESDVKLPAMPQMQQDILTEFAQRIDEFTQPIGNQSQHKRATFHKLANLLGCGCCISGDQIALSDWRRTPRQPRHRSKQ